MIFRPINGTLNGEIRPSVFNVGREKIMDEGQPRNLPSQGFYEITVEGHLKHRWSAWFEGLTVTTKENGCTILSGPVPDQAALHGILAKVRDLGLTLISVARLDVRREA
jgi:hypothetical protein